MWTTLGKAWLSLRKVGLARTAQRAIQRSIPAWLFDVNRLALCEVDLTEWQGAKPDPQWSYRWATPDDTELLMSRGLSRFEVDQLFAHGARGGLLEIDGQLVANNWAIPNRWVCFDWIEFKLAPDEMYGASSFVAPAYRGQRIHHQSRSFVMGQLAAEGYRRLITMIEVLNKSSLRASADKPRQYHGTLSYVRVLGLIIYRLKKKWGAGFWNRTRPFELSFDVFDRENFRPADKHARPGLDGR